MPWPPNYCGAVLDVRSATTEQVRAVQLQVLRPHGRLPADVEPTGLWLHVAAFAGEQVVGACSVGPAPWPHADLVSLSAPQWQLRSLAVLPDYRGGVGAQLLAAAVDRARLAAAGSLWANARVAAVGLYRRGGWQAVGPQWHKPGIGAHRYVVLGLNSPAGSATPMQE